MKRFILAAVVSLVLGGATAAIASTYSTIAPVATLNLGANQGGDRAVVSGSHLYSVGYAGFQVFDVSTPTAPVKVGSLSGADGSDVLSYGRYIFTGTDNGLNVVDVSNPTAPQLVNTLPALGGHRMAISSSHYLLALHTSYSPSELRIIDISNATAPTLTASLVLPGGANGIAISGNYALITVDDKLVIVDISNPASPQQISTLSFPPAYMNGAYGIAISGNLAYVATHGYWDGDEQTRTPTMLYIVDISKPLCPAILSSVEGMRAGEGGLVLSGNYAYLAELSCELDYSSHAFFTVVDVSNPAAPQVAGWYDYGYANGNSQGLAVVGDYVIEPFYNGLNVFKAFGATSPLVCTQ